MDFGPVPVQQGPKVALIDGLQLIYQALVNDSLTLLKLSVRACTAFIKGAMLESGAMRCSKHLNITFVREKIELGGPSANASVPVGVL